LINNFNLTCVQVDDASYSEANWSENVDEGTSFSTDCNVVEIPDENFETYLLGNSSINTNGDSFIQVSEANAFTGIIAVNDAGITDITGIEAFTNVSGLNVTDNELTEVDLSSNTQLTSLYLALNPITTLDLSQNTSLSHLQLQYMDLTSVDVSHMPGLITLWVYGNELTVLNVSNNTALTSLRVTQNPLTSLDVSYLTELTRLDAYQLQVPILDLSNNTKLTYLDAGGNGFLEGLDIRNVAIEDITHFTVINAGNLSCISVDDVDLAEANLTNVDDHIVFSTDCSNGANDILTFSFSEQTGAATIDATNHTIEIEVETGTSLTALEPTITVSEGASISPSGAQDFSNAVTYTVTAENYDEQDWTVMVTEKELTLGVSQLQNLSVYPNPTMDVVSIDGLNQPFTVQVLDLGGKEMMTSNEKELNLSGLRTGMYLLHVELADGSSKVIRISKTN
ncbi:MAG: T9SS type A sorting domain-containing protein, partial [Cyclobacteriaceae bacterium]